MSYKINIDSVNLDMKVPASKSVLHRVLIVNFLLQSLKGNPSKEVIDLITTPLDIDNQDIIATRGCLKALADAAVAGSSTDVVMPCNESGSTLRFMISVGIAYLNSMGLAATHRLVFKPKGRLINRPLDQLIDCLAEHGVSVVIDKEAEEIIVSGVMTPGDYRIEGNVSSQYISGLLMAAIVMKDSRVVLVGKLESSGYVDLTLDALKFKGIEVNISDLLENKSYELTLPSEIEDITSIEAESDWSSAAFLLSLAAIAPKAHMVLGGLNPESKQKDKIIVDIINQMGVKTSWEVRDGAPVIVIDTDKLGDGIGELTLDTKDYPDIVPYIAVLAAGLTKKTVFENVGRLKFKESDRVKATMDVLSCAEIPCSEDVEAENFEVVGKRDFGEVKDVPTYNDHRIAMMACLVAALTGKEVTIDDEKCVSKSFPGLFEILENMEGLN